MADLFIPRGADGGYAWPLYDRSTRQPVDLTGFVVNVEMRTRRGKLFGRRRSIRRFKCDTNT